MPLILMKNPIGEQDLWADNWVRLLLEMRANSNDLLLLTQTLTATQFAVDHCLKTANGSKGLCHF